MSIGAPLGLLALVAVPAVVAAYFLRRKHPPRTVSALFLWRLADRQAEAGPRFERFSREVSLALEVLALLCAALFLADLRCGTPPARAHVVVIVDGSLSMRARVNGHLVADEVKEATARLVDDEHAGAVTIIESGPHPNVIAGPRQDPAKALAALEAWSPMQPAHDLTPAFTLARDLAGPSQTIVFFTDGAPASEALPKGIRAQSFGSPLDNFAFESAMRRDEGDGEKKRATVTVRVTNDSNVDRDVVVHFECGDAAARDERLSLNAGASGVVRATFLTARAITVSLPDDALPEDSVVTLVPSQLARVGVSLEPSLDTATERALRRFFAVAEGATLTSGAAFTIGPPGSHARLTIGAPGAQKSFIGPFFADKSHPLFDDVQLGGITWTAGDNPEGRPLMTIGPVVLVSESSDGSLHFNLDISRGNLQRSVAWPVLLNNLVRLARERAPGLPRKQVILGEDVAVTTSPDATWRLVDERGHQRALIGSGVLTVPPLPTLGRWTLERNGEAVDALEVMALDARESDLRTRGPWRVEASASGLTAGIERRTRPTWLLLMMLTLILLDFWLTARPVTRRLT